MLATNEQPSLLRLRHSGCNTWLECGAHAGGVYFLDDEEACWCVFVWKPPPLTTPPKRRQQLVLTTTRSLTCVNRLRKLSVLTHFSNANHLSLKWRVFHLQYEKSFFLFVCFSVFVWGGKWQSPNNHFHWGSLQKNVSPTRLVYLNLRNVTAECQLTGTAVPRQDLKSPAKTWSHRFWR